MNLPHTLGYMLPTAAVMSAARRVENFHLFLATQPSPRQARPRADTGPPLPNLWRPAQLGTRSSLRPHTYTNTSSIIRPDTLVVTGRLPISGVPRR